MSGFSRTLRAGCIFVMLLLVLSGCGLFRSNPIIWNDTKWCAPIKLKIVLRKVARKYGPIRVHSTHRWPAENKRKGGKPKSYHLKCRAIDFSIKGDPTPNEVVNYLKSLSAVGGYARYKQGFYHIDNGPRRTW